MAPLLAETKPQYLLPRCSAEDIKLRLISESPRRTSPTCQLTQRSSSLQVVVLEDWFTQLPVHMRLVALHNIVGKNKYPGAHLSMPKYVVLATDTSLYRKALPALPPAATCACSTSRFPRLIE